MAQSVTIVGWHVSYEAAVCEDCGAPANYFCELPNEESLYSYERNLCSDCINSDRYMVTRDRVAEVFRELGL